MRQTVLVMLFFLLFTFTKNTHAIDEIHVLVTFDRKITDGQHLVLDDLQGRFNATHDGIELVIDYAESADMVALLQSDLAPDIVGPISGTTLFRNQSLWADIRPFMANFDMSDIPAVLLDRLAFGEATLALPLAVSPSVIFFNKALFDEAGLAYPPQEYSVTWDFDALSHLAQQLTIDGNGFTAGQAGFDKYDTVQWGYDNSWADTRELLALWGTNYIDDTAHKVSFDNDAWVAGIQWMQVGMHEIGFIPAGYEMDLLYDAGVTNPFQSGQVAMFTSHAWFPLQGFMSDITFAWDIAATPATNGAIHTRLHDDVFAMTRSGAENPATWSVITWLVAPEQQIALCRLDAFACIPANNSTRDETLAMLEAWMPDVSWDVVFRSIAFADNPSHERWLPDLEVMDGLLLNIYYELYYSEGETDFAAYLVEVDTEAQTLADTYWTTQNQ